MFASKRDFACACHVVVCGLLTTGDFIGANIVGRVRHDAVGVRKSHKDDDNGENNSLVLF